MAKYVYGPVPSRRLGRSLGVDLVPMKTCSFNCIYCQLGPTPRTTLERAEYELVEEIVAAVRERLAQPPLPDYVTLSGSGEPTLHTSFGRVAAEIRAFTDVPIALLTNGSLFFLPEVRRACADVDLVIPSLDAGDEEGFQRVNRPHPSLHLEPIVQGLVDLRREFEGQIWLEVFMLEGINSFEEHIKMLKSQIERFRPDRVQLNTAVRPTAEEFALPLSAERLQEICEMLGPTAEVVAGFDASYIGEAAVAREEEVVEMLKRRPCTVADIARGLAIHRNEAVKYVQDLSAKGVLESSRKGADTYYRAKS